MQRKQNWISLWTRLSGLYGILLLACAPIFAGTITYTLHQEDNPTSEQQQAYEQIILAMDSALFHYNRHTSLSKHLNVYFNPGVATADASFNGTIRFGANASYRVVITAMHEIAHTLGIGTTTEYQALIEKGVFTGAATTDTLRAITGDDEVFLHGDLQHFWPYGLNYAAEVQSEQDLINHCRIVQAIVQDLFHESLYFSGVIRSWDMNQCLQRSENALVLGDCTDSASQMQMIAMGENPVTYRMAFGDRVLDIPNESTQGGVQVGLYAWNGGTHQQFEILSLEGDSLVRLEMQHASLFLRVENSTVIQDVADADSISQLWVLAPWQPATTMASWPVRSFLPARMFLPANSFDLLGRRQDF